MKYTRALLPVLLMLVLVASVSANQGLIGHRKLKLESGDWVHILDTPDYNVSELQESLISGEIVVFYGNASNEMQKTYNTSLNLSGETDSTTNIIAQGVWLQGTNGGTNEHSLIVKDYKATQDSYNAVNHWLESVYGNYTGAPSSLYSRTEVEFQEPYGVLETITEILKMNETSPEFDWYDVTVTQTLTPGSNTSDSDWVWDQVTYTMNGSLGPSSIVLVDYDGPPSGELPTGFFSFLWRILNFNLRDYLPWLYAPELKVLGGDMSDYSLQLFMVQYRAPQGYKKSDQPLDIRHHYVIRVGDGVKPRFWQYTQVKYVKENVIASPPYYSPLLHEGYIEFR